MDLVNMFRKSVLLEFKNVPKMVHCPVRNIEIKGHVLVTVREPVEIIEYKVQLFGESQSNPIWSASDDERWKLATNPAFWEYSENKRKGGDREVHVKQTILSFSIGDRQGGDQPAGAQDKMLQPGSIEQAFSFTLLNSIPESWDGNYDENAWVGYTLTACLTYRRPNASWPRSKTEKFQERVSMMLAVRNEFPLTQLNNLDPFLEGPNSADTFPESDLKEVQFGGLEIRHRLHLPYKGFVRGEIAPVVVYIYNIGKRTIKPVSLELIQRITIRSRNLPGIRLRDDKVLSTQRLERVRPYKTWRRLVLGLKVPKYCRTDGSFINSNLISIQFFIRLTLNICCRKIVLSEVTCHVGTSRSEMPHSNFIINNRRLPIFPANVATPPVPSLMPFTLMFPEPPLASNEHEHRDGAFSPPPSPVSSPSGHVF